MSQTALTGIGVAENRFTSVAVLGACAVAAAAFGAALYADKAALFAGAVGSVAFVAVVLARPFVGLCAAFALAPLEAAGRVIPTMPAFTWAKVALALTVLAVLTRVLADDDRIELPLRFWALALLPVLGVVSSMAGGYGLNADTLTGVFSVGSSVVLVLLAYRLMRTKTRILIGALAVVAGSLPVVAFGLVEIYTKQPVFENPMFSEPLWAPGTVDVFRITSTFFDPNVFGRYLLFSILWTMCALAIPALRRARPLLVLVLALQAYCLVNTFSRAAFLAVGVVAGPFLLYAVARKWRGAGLVAAGATAVAAAVALWPILSVLLRRFDDPTAGGRTHIVLAAFPAMAESPVLGYGREHVATVLGAVIGEVTDAHNLITEIVLSFGVVGVLVMAAWAVPLAYGLVQHWRAGNPYARLVALPLLGAFIFSMSLHGYDAYELWVPMAFAAPILRMATAEKEVAACESR